MTSKTFESSRPTGTLLRVEPIEIFNEAHLTIVLPSREEDICIAQSDAPALMQAIGECLPPIPETVRDGSYEAYMSVVMTYLGRAVRALETETAEAEAQAKLEAEALELLNASRIALHSAPVDELMAGHKLKWLAVARRAREINKEGK